MQHNIKKHQAFSQKGRSMIEILGVLGLIGILGSSIYGVANTANSKSRMTQALMEIESIVEKTRTLYSWRTNYRAIGSTKDIQTYLIEQKVLTKLDDEKARPPVGVGTSLTMTGQRLSASGDECAPSEFPCFEVFTIKIYGLEKKQCSDMALFNWGRHIFKMAAGDTVLFQDILPAAPASAATMCKNKPEVFEMSFF